MQVVTMNSQEGGEGDCIAQAGGVFNTEYSVTGTPGTFHGRRKTDSHHRQSQQTLSGPCPRLLRHPRGHLQTAPGHGDRPGMVPGAEQGKSAGSSINSWSMREGSWCVNSTASGLFSRQLRSGDPLPRESPRGSGTIESQMPTCSSAHPLWVFFPSPCHLPGP